MKTHKSQTAAALLLAAGLFFLLTGCSSSQPEEVGTGGGVAGDTAATTAADTGPSQPLPEPIENQPSDGKAMTVGVETAGPRAGAETPGLFGFQRKEKMEQAARAKTAKKEREESKPAAMAGSKAGGPPSSGGGGDKPFWQKGIDFGKNTFAKVMNSPPVVLYAGLAAAAALMAFGGFLMIRKVRMPATAG